MGVEKEARPTLLLREAQLPTTSVGAQLPSRLLSNLKQ